MKSVALIACIALISAVAVTGQSNFATNQLTTSALGERAQRALFPGTDNSYVLPVANGLPAANRVDNAAGRQLQADKSAFPFLATLPNQGSANFFTVLKPCGLILPHIHQRATESYLIISGSQSAGISEENGGRQDLTFTVSAGQTFVVPQGLVHYNSNQQCTPNVFVQSFNSADPGTLSLSNALAGLAATNPTVARASNFSTVTVSPQNAFALDSACLQRCGLPATGAPGNGLSGLSQELQIFLGLANATQGPTAANPPAAAGGPISG